MKKNLLILFLAALSGVSSAVAMEPVPATTQESEDHSTIISQDGQEYRVPDRLLRLSETLKNLMKDIDTVKEALPLPNINSQTWQCIQGQLERLFNLTPEAEQNIKTDLELLTGSGLMEVIIAANYLDIPDLLRLAIDIAKEIDIKKIPFVQINTLPREIRNSIILGQMIRLWPVPDKQRAICNGHTNWVTSVCVTQDGNTVVSGSHDGTMRIWNIDGTQRASWNGRTRCVASVCVTQDGNTIVSGSHDGTMRVWNMDGKQRAICNGHTNWVTSVCVTQDGNTIVSGSNDGTVRIWNMDGTQRAICNGHTDWVNSVCVTPGGNTIVSGSNDGTVRIWNMDGTQHAICNGHTCPVESVCVTQDGNTIVSGSYDGTVRIWNMDGTQRAICNGHSGWVRSVCVTQNGNTIVSGSCDGIVRVWDMQGNQLAQGNGHTETVKCVTQNGNMIVSGSCDGTVRIWNISLLNRISTMDSEQAQKIWQYLQGDRTKNWDNIRAILDGENVDEQESLTQSLEGSAPLVNLTAQPINWVKRTALVIGAGAALALAGVLAYKWFANNSNE